MKDEKKIEYIQVGDYLLPNLKVEENTFKSSWKDKARLFKEA